MPILKYGNAKLTKVNNKLCLFLFASSLDSILILILEIETETAENLNVVVVVYSQEILLA